MIVIPKSEAKNRTIWEYSMDPSMATQAFADADDGRIAEITSKVRAVDYPLINC